MKAVVQRVNHASVTVEGEPIGTIGVGLLVLLGVAQGDSMEEVHYLADKISGLRIFEDDEGKMNLSLSDVGGSMLVVSQFTLLANTKKGKRPSFAFAAEPSLANSLYEAFMTEVKMRNIPVEHGKFGADMQILLENNGPVTIILDTANR